MNNRLKNIEKLLSLQGKDKMFLIPIMIQKWGDRYFSGGYPGFPARELNKKEVEHIKSGKPPHPIIGEANEDPMLINI